MSSPKILAFLPIFAGLVWFVTLLAMITSWVSRGSTHYPEMSTTQHFAYISNVGASGWGRPIFMGGSFATIAAFGVALAAERWLRHKGALLHCPCRFMTLLSTLTAFSMVVGSCSLIFLTIFDVRDRPSVHYPMVALFVFGYIIAAVFMSAEKFLTSCLYPNNKILRLSFRIKIVLVVIELLFVILFGAFLFQKVWAPSVVLEWIVGLFFAIYMWTCAIDFFAVPEFDEKHGVMAVVERDWDGDAALANPKKTRPKVVYKYYAELP